MKNTVVTFKQAKEKGEKLTMLTAYDYSTAKLIDEAGINAILVGDSLGMVVLGYEDTLSVTISLSPYSMMPHIHSIIRRKNNYRVIFKSFFFNFIQDFTNTGIHS